jgi:hypothetical protein
VAATAALAVVAAEEEQLDAELAATRAALEGCREVERASALMVVRRRGGSGTLVRGGGGGGGGGCYLMRAPAVPVPAPGKQRCGDAASGRRRARPDSCQRDCTAAGVQPAAASSLSCATRRFAAVPPFLQLPCQPASCLSAAAAARGAIQHNDTLRYFTSLRPEPEVSQGEQAGDDESIIRALHSD